ncbi:MAG: branched-chain amino acid ABC transporter permease [Nisaea sp.]|jgi:branched-chain amino acid transport system permease protein|uniref:branched-chain amino acid ABC transporter permease n=1 Tax=Nisaea sp. TaxID=2024842 RepID=UPI001B289069|nr:branched-chain amino acid ABC transporter permease [Nisaea sp.]MBO6562957.1 branched-chain amino acid ABC transporter permease [Nisaea sp.]
MDIVISGLLLGGAYALVAMGLNLQYGVARIMNLANGEVLVLGGLAAFWAFVSFGLSPLLTLFLIAPLAFAGSWAIYALFLRPLVKRAKSRGQLEVDTILATFGMSFFFVGLMVSLQAEYFTYSFLAWPISLLGSTVAANRLVAALVAAAIAAALYLWLNRSRSGLAVRAVAVSPGSARLVGIDVGKVSALAFSLGGMVTALGGCLISTFVTLDASAGVLFTMKALIIVIMGGVGDIRGAIIAALILGLVETAVATIVDPGLTLVAAYAIFLAVLLFRPQGLFGRRSA